MCHKGHILLDFHTQEFVSRDVIFIEYIFPYEESSLPHCSVKSSFDSSFISPPSPISIDTNFDHAMISTPLTDTIPPQGIGDVSYLFRFYKYSSCSFSSFIFS